MNLYEQDNYLQFRNIALELSRIADALERGNKLRQLEIKNNMLGMTDAAIERELKEMG